MTDSLAQFWQGTPSATATATGAALTPTSGNLLVAVVTGSGSTLASMATAMASGTTGWAQLIPDVGNNTSGTDHAVLGFWYKYASGNETPAFTTGAAGTVTSQCDVYEIAGGPSSGNPLDTYGTYASGSSSSTISSITATTSAAPSAAGEFAILAAIRERVAITTTITVSSPWTVEYQDGSTSQNGHRLDGYQTSPSTSGTLSGTVSFSGTSASAYGAGAIVVIQVGNGGGGGGGSAITNSFEGGTDGTAISTANSGGSSGTAFDSLGGSATLPVFSSAGAIHGSLGAYTPLSGNSTTTLEWKPSFTGFNSSSVPWYARDYFKITSLPPAQIFLMKAQDDAVPQDVWAIYIDTTGHLGIRNRVAGTNVATAASAVALNTPTRWEAECVYNGSTYSLTLWCYYGSNVEGTTPDETLTGSVSSADAVDVGSFGAQAASVQTWTSPYHDDIGLSSTKLGPYVPPTPTVLPSLIPAFLC